MQQIDQVAAVACLFGPGTVPLVQQDTATVRRRSPGTSFARDRRKNARNGCVGPARDRPYTQRTSLGAAPQSLCGTEATVPLCGTEATGAP